MKGKLINLFCVLCIGLICSNSLKAQDKESFEVKVKFLDSYEAALKEAASVQKPIFFDCYANWAVPCQGMDKYVFSDADFAQWLNEHFVCLRLEMTTPENQYLVQKYNVRFYAHFLPARQLDSSNRGRFEIAGISRAGGTGA